MKSVKNGLWSDPTTWEGNRLPTPNEEVYVDHVVNFDPSKSTTVQASKNIVVSGKLEMKPANKDIIHLLQFTNVNEQNFVGSGMDVAATDVGLWVIGNGQLDLVGTSKTSWTYKDYTGWNVGDDIVVAPHGTTSFTELKHAATNTYTYPISYGRFTPEIMNLTCNVRIEGTPGGHSHVLITAKKPQSIKYVQFRFMGPRKDVNGDGIKEFVLGRYGLHWHHATDGSRGSIVEGCVVRDTNSHAFVPHASHGITFDHCITYNTLETPYWYDPGHNTHEVNYESCIAAKAGYVPGSLDVADTEEQPQPPTLSTAGFLLGGGNGNKCNRCICISAGMGDAQNQGGFTWRANFEGIWEFIDCLAHHNDGGILWWQISSNFHIVENYCSYDNGFGWFHGAYANTMRAIKGAHYNSPIEIKASSINTARIRLEEIIMDGAGKIDYPFISSNAQLPGQLPVLLRDCTIKGGKKGAIHDYGSSFIFDGEYYKSLDLVNCDIQGVINLESVVATFETIRVQPKTGRIYKKTKAGEQDIPEFAPRVWGSGKGLKGEYFSSNNFTNKVFERVDPYISFEEWYQPDDGKIYVDHRIAATNFGFSVRWTGEIVPQFTEEYSFILGASGIHKLTIGSTVVVNNNRNGKIRLEAQKRYPIQIDFANQESDNKALNFGGVGLYWQSPSLDKFGLSFNMDTKQFFNSPEFVPQSQLFSGVVEPPPPPPVDENKAPTASAGQDLSITLPINSVNIVGVGSDPEGKVLSYFWEKVSGPSALLNVATQTGNLSVTNMLEGVYLFRLTVTDDKGLAATDDVIVTVKPLENKPPTVSAGPDLSIQLPINSLNIVGTGSDPEGKPVTYRWEKVSGGLATISTPTASSTMLTGLTVGTYVFRLTVTDDKGLIASDEVNITVLAKVSATSQLVAAVINSNVVQPYSITDLAGGVISSGQLAVGDNVIKFTTYHSSYLIKVGSRTYTFRR